MTEDVKVLNRRLGDSLGRPNGTDPRFAWMHSTTLFRWARKSASDPMQRLCWADQIGPCWVLCQWRPPEITVNGYTFEVSFTQWMWWFKGERPYPAKGEYLPHRETALRPGLEPNAEWTHFYIKTLREQMEQAEFNNRQNAAGRKDALTEQCEQEAQAAVESAENAFYEEVNDWAPLSWRLGNPQTDGAHDGPVAFQVGGLRDTIAPKEAA